MCERPPRIPFWRPGGEGWEECRSGASGLLRNTPKGRSLTRWLACSGSCNTAARDFARLTTGHLTCYLRSDFSVFGALGFVLAPFSLKKKVISLQKNLISSGFMYPPMPRAVNQDHTATVHTGRSFCPLSFHTGCPLGSRRRVPSRTSHYSICPPTWLIVLRGPSRAARIVLDESDASARGELWRRVN